MLPLSHFREVTNEAAVLSIIAPEAAREAADALFDHFAPELPTITTGACLMNRRDFLTLAAAAGAVAASARWAQAAGMTLAAINVAIAAGGPVLIHVTSAVVRHL